MCEVRESRRRKDPPPTPRMLALLTDMVRTGEPAVWDYSRGFRHDTYTVGDRSVPGAAVTGLEWRGFLHTAKYGPKQISYAVTDKGRALIGR